MLDNDRSDKRWRHHIYAIDPLDLFRFTHVVGVALGSVTSLIRQPDQVKMLGFREAKPHPTTSEPCPGTLGLHDISMRSCLFGRSEEEQCGCEAWLGGQAQAGAMQGLTSVSAIMAVEISTRLWEDLLIDATTYDLVE
tara:strand:+ start:2053 stop:2466 length:414 start_codon:yes stop_codon:yes gene_type:complete